jgi:hypothetical protein
LTVHDAARVLGISEDAVRMRVKRGTLQSEREGGRLYVFLTPEPTHEPTDRTNELIGELKDRVRSLEEQLGSEREANRENRRIIAALTSRIPELPAASSPEPLESRGSAPEEPEGGDLRASTGGAAKREATRPPAPSAVTSRLGMSARALAVGAIATGPAWFYSSGLLFVPEVRAFILPHPDFVPKSFFLFLLLFLLAYGAAPLVPLVSGLWAGSTKRPSLPWFSSPHRWLRRGGRSVLKIAVFAAGVPAWVGIAITFSAGVVAGGGISWFSWSVLAVMLAFTTLLSFTLAPLAFMSGAFLGNALRRAGFLGTPQKPPQGEEEGEQEEEVWSPRKEARWGLAGTLIAALISAVASVVAATLS